MKRLRGRSSLGERRTRRESPRRPGGCDWLDRVLRQKRELFEAVLGSPDNHNASLGLNAAEIFGLFDLKARSARGTKRIGPEAASEPELAAA